MLSAQSLNHRNPHAQRDLAEQIPLTLTAAEWLNLCAPRLTRAAAHDPVILSVSTNFLSAASHGSWYSMKWGEEGHSQVGQVKRGLGFPLCFKMLIRCQISKIFHFEVYWFISYSSCHTNQWMDCICKKLYVKKRCFQAEFMEKGKKKDIPWTHLRNRQTLQSPKGCYFGPARENRKQEDKNISRDRAGQTGTVLVSMQRGPRPIC